MLFNSLIFLVFGAVFFAGWGLAKRTNNIRWGYLTVASFLFYGWWDWRFLFLIAASGLLDFYSGLGMALWPTRRRLFLGLSILGNVGSLMVFKYSGFFADNLTALLGLVGLDVELRSHLPSFVLILPVGISFYTFQSMSYTIDIYKGQLQPTRNILHFFAYLSMFPQLVAGPIIRASDLLPQLCTANPVSEEDRWEGTRRILHGFVKKVVVADHLALFVDTAFTEKVPQEATLFWWLVMSAFAVQIYCDFSGYSDIARGLAKWMGYDFMVNFNHPYVATSLREFWSRWHISLSTWFRDYVYIPLGGSRKGKWRGDVNMWMTMLISGFWHGAAWNFVIWGGLHAFGTSFERVTRWPERVRRLPGGRYCASFILLAGVWVTWVFFRAGTFGQAWFILTRMFSFDGGVQTVVDILGGRRLVELAVILGAVWLREWTIFSGLNHWRWLGPEPRRRWADVAMHAAMLVILVFQRGPGSQFIYFQF